MKRPWLWALLIALIFPSPASHAAAREQDMPPVNMETLFGPTNINAATGNGGMAVGVSREGDVTVLRWPTPSNFDHVDHLAVDFHEPRMGDKPTAGVFAGLIVDGAVTWLREAPWAIGQGYFSDEDSVVVTAFDNSELDLIVRQLDFVIGEADVLVRRYELEPGPACPLGRIELVLFENLDPCNVKYPLVPVRDWLLDPLNDGAVEFDPETGILHHYRPGSLLQLAIHFAVGADRTVSGWQCGIEEQSGGPELCALNDLADGSLSGNTSAGGQVDAALAVPVDLSMGADTATFYFAAGADCASAGALLERTRARSSDHWRNETSDWWGEWIGRAILPNTENEEIIRTAKRLLVSLRVGTDRDSGMIVASISGQPPYYVDWPRDGAVINHALDLVGYTEMVTAHNLYYARIQRDSGSYWMNYNPDGTPGGPLPLEVDGDGILLWELWEHASFLDEPGRGEYLEAVYPAIRKGADFLCSWRDPQTGLPLPSFELDSPVPKQTCVSAAAVLAGMKAAVAAGEAFGEEPERLERWRERLAEITEAILAHYYDAEQGLFTDDGWGGATLIWPAQIFPADHPAVQDLAGRLYEAQRPAIEMTAEYGSYNGVAMDAVVHAWKDYPARREELVEAVTVFMTVLPTPDTCHWGEGWIIVEGEEGPAFENHVAMPHLLTGAYHLIAAMMLFGPAGPEPGDKDGDEDDNDGSGHCGCATMGGTRGTTLTRLAGPGLICLLPIGFAYSLYIRTRKPNEAPPYNKKTTKHSKAAKISSLVTP